MPAQYKRGFAFLLILAVLGLIGIAATAGLYFVTKNSSLKTTTPAATNSAATNTTTDENKDWKTYTNSEFGFSIKYPKDKIVENAKTQDFLNVSFGGDDGTGYGAPTPPDFSVLVYSKSNLDELTKVLSLQRGGTVTLSQNRKYQKVGDIVVDGTSASQLSLDLGTGEGSSVAVIQKGNFIYFIQRTHFNQETQDKFFDQILSTFKFIQ